VIDDAELAGQGGHGGSEETEQFVNEVRCKQGSDLAIVIRRRNLHQITSHNSQTVKGSHSGEDLRAAEPTYLRCSGSGRECRVDNVDIERDVDVLIPVLAQVPLQ